MDHKSTFYLSYLQDPSPEASPLKCSCEVRGQNLSVMTLEQTRAYLSPVVYILTSETVTKHITKTVIRHRLEFSDISLLRVELDFRFPGQEFRLWLKLTGTGELGVEACESVTRIGYLGAGDSVTKSGESVTMTCELDCWKLIWSYHIPWMSLSSKYL